MNLGQPRKVGLLVETSHGSGREILRGIGEYAHRLGNFQLFHYPRGLEEGVPGWLADWDGDGIIARIQTPEVAEALANLSVPVVDVLGVVENAGFPLVHVDDIEVARIAARYFRDLGYREFGFFGLKGENWSERRKQGFVKALRKVSVLEEKRNTGEPSDKITEWIRNLEKPCGVMVASDQLALSLVEVCRSLQLAIPEQVSVLSVDNDVPLCEISSPPLSSIRAGHFQVGVEAGRLLDRLMQSTGKDNATAETILVPPGGIVTRSSTDSLALHDSAVAIGVNFLRRHLSEPITNETVARASGISRTLFQKRFREATGKTIRQFLIELRLERARALITTTDLPFCEIAERCGFRHQEYMGDVLKKYAQTTPGQLRKESRNS